MLSGLVGLLNISTVQPLAVYFVSENRIFQSPDLYTLLSNRLVRLASSVCGFLLKTYTPVGLRSVHSIVAGHSALP